MRRFVTALAALALGACQLFVKVDDEKGVAHEDSCTHLLPPPRVTTAEEGKPQPPLFFAGKDYVVLPSGMTPPGFDLDGKCTGTEGSTTDQPACVPPKNGMVVPDSAGGVDNSFSGVIETSAPGTGDLAGASLTRNASNGRFTVLVQITNYNGLANDEDVLVAFISASHPTCPGGCPDDAPSFVPGADTWKFGGSNLVLKGTANLAAKGYVAGGIIVAESNEVVTFDLAGGSQLHLSHTTMTGALEPDGDTFKLSNVVMGGIVPVDDILNFAGNVEPLGAPLCKVPQAFKGIADSICQRRDVRADFATDKPCDSLSFGFKFETVRALLGVQGPDPVRSCSDSEQMHCPAD